MDSDDDDDVTPRVTLYDFLRSKALAHACEWCLYDQHFGVCNGQGKECRAMASYHEAQTCGRLASLCRDSILSIYHGEEREAPPVCASLQDRIVALVSRRISTTRGSNDNVN